jgi:putative chitinase
VSNISEAEWLRILVAMGVKPAKAAEWAAPFAAEIQPAYCSAGMDDIRALVPQILHETLMLQRLEESLSYTPERIREVWPSRFPTVASAIPYAHSPKKLANKVYANRMGNGDEASGDGWLFRGQGPGMLTGRAGFRRAGELAGQDLESLPQLVLQKRFGLEILLKWWEGEIPDEYLSDQAKLRRRYNGALLGLEHVSALSAKMEQALA